MNDVMEYAIVDAFVWMMHRRTCALCPFHLALPLPPPNKQLFTHSATWLCKCQDVKDAEGEGYNSHHMEYEGKHQKQKGRTCQRLTASRCSLLTHHSRQATGVYATQLVRIVADISLARLFCECCLPEPHVSVIIDQISTELL